jgi:multidrug efflux pump subunit AcrA (membrane-fusion protein)
MSKTIAEDVAMKHYSKILFVVLIFTVALASCSSAEQATPAPENSGNENFSAVISATGVVVPEQWAALSARNQGVVDEVLVKEGQQVKKGQTLIRLGNNESAQAEVARAQENLIAAERAFGSAQANALKDLDEAYEAVRKAQYDFDNFDIPSDLRGMSTTEALNFTSTKLEEARKNFEPYKYLEERLEWEMRNDDPENPKVYKDTAKIYKKRLDDAWADFNRAIRWVKLEADLQQAKSELDNALKEFNAVSDNSQDTSLARAQYLAAQANLSAAQAALADMELTAPFDGVVCNLEARVGEWVTPGIPILQLGDLDNLRVETTDLSEIDAARVHPEDVVLVTFDALPDVVVNGTVLSVANKSAEGSGVNYTVVVALNSIPAGLRWGMTAFADIEVIP